MLKLYFATYKGLVRVDVAHVASRMSDVGAMFSVPFVEGAQILGLRRPLNRLQLLPHIFPDPLRLLFLPSGLVHQILVMLGHNFVVIFHFPLIMLQLPHKNLLQ